MSDTTRITRRGFTRSAGAITAGLGLGAVIGTARAGAATAQSLTAASPGVQSSAGPEQRKIAPIAQNAMGEYDLKALILRVTTDGKGSPGASGTGHDHAQSQPEVQASARRVTCTRSSRNR